MDNRNRKSVVQKTGQGKYPQYLIMVIFIALFSFICSKYFYQLLLIQGSSMYPAYHNMQLVIIDKHDNTYSTGDIVAVHTDKLEEQTVTIVKRIAAEPGDSVMISNGMFFVNGEVPEFYQNMEFADAGLLSKPVMLSNATRETEEYVILGDNVEVSKDSRVFGPVQQKDIIGKIIFAFP